jgi:hypothetical protein
MLAEVLAHIAEVDARKIYLLYGPSMYAYCTDVLRLSESAAYARIRAARLARRFPDVFDDVATGRLNVSGLNIIAPYVDADGALLAAARGQSTQTIRKLVAAHAPRPSVPDSITPISADQAVVRFTASMAFVEKLDRAKALLSHSVPDGKLDDILTRALDAVIAATEKTRFAKTAAPKRARRSSARTRYIPATNRRTVHVRDDERCTFILADGSRCKARAFLQYHHDDPYGKDGTHDPKNVRLLCRLCRIRHNRHYAERRIMPTMVANARKLLPKAESYAA